MRARTFPALLWAVSLGFYIAGLVFPLMSTSTGILGIKLEHHDIRLLDSVLLFAEERDYFIAAVIVVFTVLLPVSKYVELAIRIVMGPAFGPRLNKILHAIDKWSMVDVFLAALLILNFKMNVNFVAMDLKSGTVYLGVSVLVRMACVHFADRPAKGADVRE